MYMKSKHPFRFWGKDDSSAAKTENEVALVRKGELEVGQILGEGGFAQVVEVSHRSLPEGNGRHYAMKMVRKKLQGDKQRFRNAAYDLAKEAKLLSALDHPNVLKLRALPKATRKGFLLNNDKKVNDFFLVTDRLTETLCDRIYRWKMYHTDTQRQEMLPLKIDYACQIASALQYLHNNRIVFRDLKPENVGFKGRHHVVLFDFGLSRELPPIRPKTYWMSSSFDDSSTKDASITSTGSQEETYKMTICGTQRYMSKEVLLGGNYNCKSDVYSFAMVLWELLTEVKPFHYMSPSVHKILVCQRGERPPLEKFLIPPQVQEVLTRAWEEDIAERLTMTQACDRLQVFLEADACQLSTVDSLSSRTHVFVDLDTGVPMDLVHDKTCSHETGIEVTSNWTLFLPHDEESMVQLQ